jgi:para-nitrobenzyl esterase
MTVARTANEDRELLVETSYGWVKGIKDEGVLAFYGLPYASPPLGVNRFRPPLSPEPWNGIYQSDAFGDTAPQHVPLTYNPSQSEDCLTLNIWTSGTETPARPVLLYIHGGGFTSGSGSNPIFNGKTFAENGSCVVVTINYRLGVLGFLDLSCVLGEEYGSSGNTGLLDMIAALRWVQENISRFGGNPKRVTIMGQSAGGKSVGALLCSPLAEGLFHQAIAISGSVQAIRDRDTAAKLTSQYLHVLGLAKESAHRLLELPAKELIAAQHEWVKDLRGVHFFGPVIDGHVLYSEPLLALSRQGKELPPLLIGTASNETAGFIADDVIMQQPSMEVLRSIFGCNADNVKTAYERTSGLPLGDPHHPPDLKAWESVLTDYMYTIGAYRTAETYIHSGAPVWVYRFDAAGPRGAVHGSERPYIWRSGYAPNREALAERMHHAWTRFIHTGQPGPAVTQPEWPRYQAPERAILLFDDTCTVSDICNFHDDSNFPTQTLKL